MRVVIPSFNRPHTIKTIHILRAAGYENYNILLHDEEQLSLYRQNPSVDLSKIIVTGAARGITNQRRWIAKNFAETGEWFVSLDDNISSFTGVSPPNYSKSDLPVQANGFDKRVFDYPIGFKTLLERWRSDIAEAEKRGANYVGFATVPNFYFLGKKWRDVGYVISKAVLIRNVGVDYDPQLEAMEDFGYCAEHLRRFGRVLINNWLTPVAGHYEPGGIGTYSQRLPRKIKDCDYLMAKYPGLFRYKVKSGCHPRAELQFRFTSTKQVDAWRKGLK